MSDPFEQLIKDASQQFLYSCFRPRYRVTWLTGPAQSGKSILARRLCDQHNWQYLDYTLEAGYFDQLATRLVSYQPEDFTCDLQRWCMAGDTPVMIIDEIDPLLAFWSYEQRRVWVASIAKLARLPRSLLLVSHFLDLDQLLPYLPDNDRRYCFDLPGERP